MVILYLGPNPNFVHGAAPMICGSEASHSGFPEGSYHFQRNNNPVAMYKCQQRHGFRQKYLCDLQQVTLLFKLKSSNSLSTLISFSIFVI